MLEILRYWKPYVVLSTYQDFLTHDTAFLSLLLKDPHITHEYTLLRTSLGVERKERHE